jgi:hypothetical protein
MTPKFPRPRGRSEREALKAAFDRIRAEWGFARSYGPSDLLRCWEKFVQEVEMGYELSIYDFLYDLSLRDLFEEIKETVPLRLRQEIDEVLKPWDERYQLATEPSDRPLEVDIGDGAREWWFRVPKQAGADVERYLFERGFRHPE